MKQFLTVTDIIISKSIDLSSSVILHNADCFRIKFAPLVRFCDYIDRERFSVT
jgi:hypothetical protein